MKKDKFAKLENKLIFDMPAFEDHLESRSKFGRSATEDNVEDKDNDLLSEKDNQGRTLYFCVEKFSRLCNRSGNIARKVQIYEKRVDGSNSLWSSERRSL